MEIKKRNLEEQNEYKESQEIGIDLGTTNTVVSYIDEDREIKFLKLKGEYLIPSMLYIREDNTVCYGNEAKKAARGTTPGTKISLFKKRLRTDSEKYKVRIQKKVDLQQLKYYVIDTNVFIDKPDILSTFNENDRVILPITVEQELEFRLNDVNTQYSAKTAIKEIIAHKDIIEYESSDLTLLPEDFFVTYKETHNNAKNDNKILSIVIKKKGLDPVLITTDNQLCKLKSDFVGVEALTLKEFLNIRKKENITYEEYEISGEKATAKFLCFIRQQAQETMKKRIDHAVITVPANFNTVEIESTKRAALDAGFEEVYIEKEPTAAAIAYNADKEQGAYTFVYDFGGGTFDVSIIKSEGKKAFDVCAVSGNSKLGGEDLTKLVQEYIFEYIEDEYDVSFFSEDESGLTTERYEYNCAMIYRVAEMAKVELSSTENTTINLHGIYITEEKTVSLTIELSRKEFEELIKPTINKAQEEMKNALSKCNMLAKDMNNIVMAGGTSLIPCLAQQVERFFGRKPSVDKNSATLIAEGAALIANSQFGTNKQGCVIPKVYDYTIEDFGVALEKWVFSPIICEGEKLPASIEKEYMLLSDYQTEISIKIYTRSKGFEKSVHIYDQGVEYLDEVTISGIPPVAASEVKVMVNFELTRSCELGIKVVIVKNDGTVLEEKNLKVDRESLR